MYLLPALLCVHLINHLMNLSLVGLLSFMTSEEMTTGSVSASAADRRNLAAHSHAWNIKQRKFSSLFPDYAQTTATPLPNMGQRSLPAESASAGTEETSLPHSTKTNSPNPTNTEINTTTSPTATSTPPSHETASSTPDDAPSPAAQPKSGIAARRAQRKAAAQANTSRSAGQVNAHPPIPPHAARRGVVGTLFSLGQRKVAVAAALVAYLFLSRLASRVGSHADAAPA